MSKLEELINKLSPNGVEYKKFNDFAMYIRGVSYSKTKEINNGYNGYKLLRANNITLSTNSLNFDEVKIIDFLLNLSFDKKIITEKKYFKLAQKLDWKRGRFSFPFFCFLNKEK